MIDEKNTELLCDAAKKQCRQKVSLNLDGHHVSSMGAH